MTALAIFLAVLNAVCYTTAARLQHQATHATAPVAGRSSRTAALVRSPRWLAGLALLATGGALHVTALRLAPVTVVQPLGVTTIVLSVLWGAYSRSARPGWTTVLALVGIVVGAGSFAAIAARVTVPTTVTSSAQLKSTLLVAAVLAGCVTIARRVSGPARALTLALGAGSAYGCMSVMMRATGEELTSGGVGPGFFGALAALGLTVAAGFLLVQGSHASGPPEITVACLTLVDPFVAVLIGVGLLGEAPGLTPNTATAALACWTLALLGVLHITRTTVATPLATPAAVTAAPVTAVR
ncbi:hypothetical protein AB0O07_07070 [Streptomyces sp. NPDC093085]|uniref:hypothetical protein n=1 Tax=Streptomyces sp. NPDC093085 TaxID=3155068 RepID=UPI003442B103